MTVEQTAPVSSRRLTGWCTISQAASALDVSRDTVRRWIVSGDLYAERLGPRLIRVDLGSVERVPLGPRCETDRSGRDDLNEGDAFPAGADA
ncbi:excisionase family DNA-binding protein [Microbacterium aquimaris]|uniref:Helix-turn-helix domain-containing protein n=1 Tax=Microbacterium aquimaris TaxID=459816 RepID=A0ABU5N7B9_9MICO|nr:helix-turn-helix domain-containing protein [Microbacterium aquimaris]MDZ8161995.1 helix-turn-helix domain-containing protein [Microbacterium aquimaris]